MIKINASSINDLISLHESGAPVTLTSHPGNASLYKLTLWQCGIPEHLWDVTCCKSDANNWPMFKLENGEAELLITSELHERIQRETSPEKRFVTAYQPTKTGERLGRVHVRVMEKLFPGAISSCSRLLLSEEARLREVFYFLAETRFSEVFARRIDSNGTMGPYFGKPHAEEAVDSFISVLRELDHLLFSDEPIETRGGLVYDGVMVQLSTMLAQFWKTDRTDRYDISGPDMIHYSSRPGYQFQLSEMLRHLHEWNPALVPKHFAVRMFPGTVARVGYIKGHESEKIMERKRRVLEASGKMSSDFKRALWERAKHDEELWPMKIKPSTEHYFSQHDLALHGKDLTVDDFWKEIPIEKMWDELTRANALLRI